ncbi:hypothetical protein P280DRAFT_334589 [Massarina eburnea CBS 473.64]|uniref:Tyrosine specific protein phosphatases domain-containing protein n=1 Tax=Massarina eburnea CBS 473.64 TaxID=1395130 RepID=A0A6A6RI85_9PLEO|nr:hypothetical protein P280DRAFT_334589 [Massarina eburnea CBS 473.64]
MDPTKPTKGTNQQPIRPNHPSYPPFHRIPGLSNFRDIGGWPITLSSPSSTPSHVRKGLIYRGSDTTRITPDGEACLRELGIKRDYDLRSRQQIEKTGGYKDIDGIERVWTPVFGEEGYTEEKARERYKMYAGDGTDGIVKAFLEILHAGAPMFYTVLTSLLSQSCLSSDGTPPAVFIHCTTGNNRTGIFISLLLLLLRVPESYIVHEYTLSDAGLAPTRHINVERLLAKGAFNGLDDVERKRKCERMVGARSESMRDLIKIVVERWGVYGDGYFRDVVGLTEKEVEGLRALLTVEGEGMTKVNGVVL